ncbi:MAG: hypothetical protein ACRC4U_07095 [Shewanella sp.]
MELTRDLLTSAAFDSVSVSNVDLTAKLVEQVPHHSLALFGCGFYALGLLHRWYRHWLIPSHNGAQFDILPPLKEVDSYI